MDARSLQREIVHKKTSVEPMTDNSALLVFACTRAFSTTSGPIPALSPEEITIFGFEFRMIFFNSG